MLQAVGDGGMESEWSCSHQLAACFCMLALHMSQQRLARVRAAGAQFACFTGALLVLYWYKSTNTDASSRGSAQRAR